jgi:hypothetical protein
LSTGRGRRAAVASSALLVFGALGAGAASAHPFSGWTGKSGPFRWQAETVSCGAVTGGPNRVEAHTRWLSSPANGYQRATFRRQIWKERTHAWKTVVSQSRTTKNTPFEGVATILHWTQFYQPASGEEGNTSRDVVLFAWRRDRSGSDRTVFFRRVALEPCVVRS